MDEDRLFALVTTLSTRLTLLEVALASMARHLSVGDALAADLAALCRQAAGSGVPFDDTRLVSMLSARAGVPPRAEGTGEPGA